MPTTWTNTSGNSSTWVNGHYDFMNIWSEWGSFTWGQLASTGYTWGALSGLTFTNTAGNGTTWTNT